MMFVIEDDTNNRKSSVIYSYREENDAYKDLKKVIDHLEKNPIPFVETIKLGRFKDDVMIEMGFMEPFVLIIIISDENDLLRFGEWIIKIEAKCCCNSMYIGYKAISVFDRYAITLKEFSVLNGKVLDTNDAKRVFDRSGMKRVEIEWEDEKEVLNHGK